MNKLTRRIQPIISKRGLFQFNVSIDDKFNEKKINHHLQQSFSNEVGKPKDQVIYKIQIHEVKPVRIIYAFQPRRRKSPVIDNTFLRIMNIISRENMT